MRRAPGPDRPVAGGCGRARRAANPQGAPVTPYAAHDAAPVRRRHGLGLGTLRILVFLAWRNLWRNRLRSSLTVGGMVVGLTLMIAYLALMEGLFRQMTGFATNISIGHIQVHRQAYIHDQDLYALLPWSLVNYLEQNTPYDYAPRLYAAALASAGESSSGALLKGIDPQREVLVTDLYRRIRRGAFELTGVRQVYPRGRNEPPVPEYPIVIGYNLARNLQVDVGSELVLITQAADGSIGNGLFLVRGVLAPVDPTFDRMGVLLSIDAFNSLMFIDGGVHELAVNVGDPGTIDTAHAELERAVRAWPGRAMLEADGGGPIVVRTWAQINPELHGMLVNSKALIYIVAVIVFVIAAMGILNTMLMATYERRHELAILLALGMGRGAMMLMVLLEGLFLACFGALVGSGTGVALALYLQVYGFDWSRWLPEGLDLMGVVMDPVYYGHLRLEHVLISVAMLLGTTLVAVLVPSWRTGRLQPARALHP
jgi:putative ABC transport system permease protein